MANCSECSKEYDPETVNIPSPMLDRMCYICGNTVTEEEGIALAAELGIDLEASFIPSDEVMPILDITP
jgi:hypothetical protein